MRASFAWLFLRSLWPSAKVKGKTKTTPAGCHTCYKAYKVWRNQKYSQNNHQTSNCCQLEHWDSCYDKELGGSYYNSFYFTFLNIKTKEPKPNSDQPRSEKWRSPFPVYRIVSLRPRVGQSVAPGLIFLNLTWHLNEMSACFISCCVREYFSNYYYYVIAEPTLPFALEEQSPNSFRRRSEIAYFYIFLCFPMLEVCFSLLA